MLKLFTDVFDEHAGTGFPIARTLMTITATDQAGNRATCTFVVTVLDIQQPTFPTGCSPSIVQNTDLGKVCPRLADDVLIAIVLTADCCGELCEPCCSRQLWACYGQLRNGGWPELRDGRDDCFLHCALKCVRLLCALTRLIAGC